MNIEPQEGWALFWSFSYFFTLLCSYYIIRPLRDEMGVAGGASVETRYAGLVERIAALVTQQWLFVLGLLLFLQ